MINALEPLSLIRERFADALRNQRSIIVQYERTLVAAQATLSGLIEGQDIVDGVIAHEKQRQAAIAKTLDPRPLFPVVADRTASPFSHINPTPDEPSEQPDMLGR